MTDTKLQLLEELCPRLSGESTTAYNAFADFVLLDLSLGELIKKYQETSNSKAPTKKYFTLCTWSSQFKWNDRRQRWRSHQLKLREEKLLREYDEYRNKMIENAKALTEKAEAMLKHPLVEQKIKRSVKVGETDVPTEVTIKPCRWSAKTIAEYLTTAADLMQQAVGDEAWAIEHLTRLGYVVLRDEEDVATKDGEED